MSTSRRARVLCALAPLAVAACGGSDDGDEASEPYPRPDYRLLSQTGLYSDTGTLSLSENARPFEPAHALWSDAADKARWIALPDGAAIDTDDMDRWVFPLGTRLWKEFSLDGTRLETRLLERYGTGRDDFWLGAFVWNEEQTEATLAEPGQRNVLGTGHDVPAQEDCGACHNGEPGRVLGFSALQLSHTATSADEWTLTALVDEGRLSRPPAGAGYAPPGDAVTASALGYLHANCGHCHNSRGTSWPDTQMVLRLFVGETLPEQTSLHLSVVGEALDYYRDSALSNRVVAGEPEQSALIERMRPAHPCSRCHRSEPSSWIRPAWTLSASGSGSCATRTERPGQSCRRRPRGLPPRATQPIARLYTLR